MFEAGRVSESQKLGSKLRNLNKCFPIFCDSTFLSPFLLQQENIITGLFIRKKKITWVMVLVAERSTIEGLHLVRVFLQHHLMVKGRREIGHS